MEYWRLRILGHLSGAWQYRWYGLAVACALSLAGWVGLAFVPNSFQSEATVYIDTDTLLRPLLKGLAVSTDTQQQVNVMLHTLLTTPNLERVVRATNPAAANMPDAQIEQAALRLGRKVTLTNLGPPNLYSIAFTGPTPSYSQSVTQALLSVLIDSNIGNLRLDSDNVQQFLDSQIADYQTKLERADKRRADFKAAHLNFFSASAHGDTVVGGSVVGAKAAVSQAQTALSEDVSRRNSLIAQLRGTNATLDVNAPAPVVIGGSPAVMGLRGELAAAEAQLQMLRTRFTDSYPDVVSTKHLIARLKAEIAKGGNADSGNMQGISNPAYVAIRSKLADMEANIAVDRDRLADAQKRLDEAKKTSLQAISVQRQYENLDRDYTVLHKNYEQLVARRESANISQAAGSQQSAVFRVVDPPRKPEHPNSPNRLLFNAGILILGMLAGVGAAVGLSEFSAKTFSVESLNDAFALPVIGAVTIVQTAADLAQQRRTKTAFVAGLCVLVFAYLIVLYLYHSPIAAPQGSVV